MWEKIFSSVTGRVLGSLLLILIGFCGTLIVSYWNANVASPEYVDQSIEKTKTELKIEDQKIQDTFTKSNEKVVQAVEKLSTEVLTLKQTNLIFQTQMSSDLNYVKDEISELKEGQSELKVRVRNIEAGKSGN